MTPAMSEGAAGVSEAMHVIYEDDVLPYVRGTVPAIYDAYMECVFGRQPELEEALFEVGEELVGESGTERILTAWEGGMSNDPEMYGVDFTDREHRDLTDMDAGALAEGLDDVVLFDQYVRGEPVRAVQVTRWNARGLARDFQEVTVTLPPGGGRPIVVVQTVHGEMSLPVEENPYLCRSIFGDFWLVEEGAFERVYERVEE